MLAIRGYFLYVCKYREAKESHPEGDRNMTSKQKLKRAAELLESILEEGDLEIETMDQIEEALNTLETAKEVEGLN